MNLRQAAQQALEALMKSHTHPLLPDDCEAAITALRAALAEPEQKGWFTVEELNKWATKLPQTTHWEGCEEVHPECRTAPTPRKWVGLTDEDFRAMGFSSRPGAYAAIEAKLKEKNT